MREVLESIENYEPHVFWCQMMGLHDSSQIIDGCPGSHSPLDEWSDENAKEYAVTLIFWYQFHKRKD